MKRSRIHTNIFCLLIISLLSVSTTQKESEEEGMPEEVVQMIRDKVDRLYKKRLNDCLEDIRLEAARKVDSVIISFDRLVEVDSFLIGSKPSKPAKPIFKTGIDTAPVREPDSILLKQKQILDDSSGY